MWLYNFAHGMYLHSWDILTLVALFCMVLMGCIHHHNQKKREKKLEEELENRAEETREEEKTKVKREKLWRF